MNRRQRKRLRKKARLAALQQRQQRQQEQLSSPILDHLTARLDSSEPVTMAPNSPQKVSGQLKVAASYSFSGPLPPPELLAKYNDVVTNGAERLMQMVEKQQDHRQDLEKTVIHGNVRAETRGQWMGLAISVMVLCIGGYLAYIGQQIAGSVFVGADLTALAGVFVYGKHIQRQELARKNEQFKKK